MGNKGAEGHNELVDPLSVRKREAVLKVQNAQQLLPTVVSHLPVAGKNRRNGQELRGQRRRTIARRYKMELHRFFLYAVRKGFLTALRCWAIEQEERHRKLAAARSRRKEENVKPRQRSSHLERTTRSEKPHPIKTGGLSELA
jgi:hypothetical protein